MGERVYRASAIFLWVSILCAIVALLFTADFVLGFFEKLPPELDSFWLRVDPKSLLGAVVCTALAVVSGMARRNISLTLGAGGIEARGLLGRVCFTVKWPEIVELEQGSPRADWPLWRVIAKGKRLDLDGRYEKFKEIPEAVYRYAPHLRPS